MDLDRKQKIESMHDSLVVFNKKGQAEHLLDPIPGQMSLRQIMRIKDETELDEHIAAQLPEGVSAFKRLPYLNDEGKRFEMKRFVLARLMGVSSRSEEVQSTFDYVRPESREKEGGSLPETLDGRMKHLISDECVARIENVWQKLAREAGALVLSPENQKIMDDITNVLNTKKLQTVPPLTQLDVLNIYNLPRHDTSDLRKGERGRIDITTVLNLFLLCLKAGHFQWDNLAQRSQLTGNMIRQIFSRMMGKRGKEVIRMARGYNKAIYKNRQLKSSENS